MKRSQPRRDWTDARAKVDSEAMCRLHYLYDCDGPLETAHVTGREYDRPWLEGAPTIRVDPLSVVPLCRRHHRMYDAHEVDLLEALEVEEQVRAVEDLDGIENARIRTCPSLYRRQAA